MQTDAGLDTSRFRAKANTSKEVVVRRQSRNSEQARRNSVRSAASNWISGRLNIHTRGRAPRNISALRLHASQPRRRDPHVNVRRQLRQRNVDRLVRLIRELPVEGQERSLLRSHRHRRGGVREPRPARRRRSAPPVEVANDKFGSASLRS